MMVLALSLVAVLAAPPPGGIAFARAGFSAALDLRPTLAEKPVVAAALEQSPRPAPPPCLGDVCQPRVALPGQEPRYSMRGKKTELFLRALDRAGLEPFASWAYWLAATGLRLDALPRSAERPAQVELFLRLRIDAWCAPVPLARPRA